MTTAWSRYGITISWRTDEFGKPERALYVGSIYVGSLTHESRRFGVGGREIEPREKPWRAWFMNDIDGNELGWYPTEQEARDAMVDAAVKGLFG